MNRHKDKKDTILIVDFGSQYSMLISRRVREMGVYCKICTFKDLKKNILEDSVKGVILSGSPNSVVKKNDDNSYKFLFESGVPVLGICYGMHLMSLYFQGKVITSKKKEFGRVKLSIHRQCSLTQGIYDDLDSSGFSKLKVWMSHSDIIEKIPKNFQVFASTENCRYAIIGDEKKKIYGVQFHPEVTHTNRGKHIIRRFVFSICHCENGWKPNIKISNMIQKIRNQIGNDQIILAFSGGVDSFVTALLIHRAVGKNLFCIFVDTGLLRLHELERILKYSSRFHFNLIVVSEEDRFLRALRNVKSPEKKRMIVGKIFTEIFNEQARKRKNVRWFAQGTIYPDVIESKLVLDQKNIKSHHNVRGLVGLDKSLKILEPIKNLFKDEVREIAKKLEVPKKVIYGHPFPGPGISIRILGCVKKKYCEILRQADHIFTEELLKHNLYYKVSQSFAIFIPMKSVGIMGDNRKYEWIISLRAIKTNDFMTADWFHFPRKFLERVSNRIINEVNSISRVVYDISSKPPSTIEWE
ncbi:glutamine-hydrolyzing GMP synthase [Candidatus Riesia pediculicola]|mgnify:CR=1 FL=1|uniref:GMP synthase [glutamine-hydrolyzing] n=1 Tax=Riesia pediculicola (strain USDA) TaxID=515618 RepID=D4G7S2_RIEPU|nr:glutamine-hydrolyzing GMP synthase [Candidatus Riesia pediculicola]ADD79922.1 GMP synthase (glutamine-hydrolyzing) [Candidatus Riesia pediculicola USDA]ARC53642.1 GMP synthase [Candidatus Riesia pediculicola]QOJ86292.1 glutamine-hydrolyzing GMP synthase [Candidatus Riesia pediculicola]